MARRSSNPVNLAEAFDGFKSDYAAAKSSRFRRRRTGIVNQGSGADWHYRTGLDYMKMVEYARDMDRNDSIIGQAIDRAVLNVVQNGFTHDPQTGDEGLDKELFDRFEEWGNDPRECDAAGEMTFAEMQEHVYRATLVDGDIFAIPLQDGPLQLVECHRCRTPSNTKVAVANGIKIDDMRRRVEYWFTKDDIDPGASLTKVGDIAKYPAFDKNDEPAVFHVFNPKRVSQSRGVTALAPVFDLAGMLEDVNFAKLVQQQIVSCFAIIRQREAGFKTPSAGQFGEQEQIPLSDGSQKLVEGISPGMVIEGAPGEMLSGFSPRVPNAEYFEQVRLIITLLGVNIGLPFVMMMMDASDTNYSGWRGAVDQARMGFRRNQRWLKDRFHHKVYRWKLLQFAADDAAIRRRLTDKKVKFFNHRWNAPRWPYIEPMKDAQADLVRLKSLQISPRRLSAERGQDCDVVSNETVADNGSTIRLAIAESKAIETETGVKVDWSRILFLTENELITTTQEMTKTDTGQLPPKKKPARAKPAESQPIDDGEED